MRKERVVRDTDKNLGWDELFMSAAYLFSMKSKDPSSRIGAIIIGEDNEPISWGFNGICRGVKDNLPERNERPAKYFWYEHGERNAIYNAARMGHKVKGATMYTQGVPCADCARGIIQSGIRRVIVHAPWQKMPARPKWDESCNVSRIMFEEAGVLLLEYHGKIVRRIKGRCDGKEI